MGCARHGDNIYSVKYNNYMGATHSRFLLLSAAKDNWLLGLIRSRRNDKEKRKDIYRKLMDENNGICPCYVCGKHVTKKLATLEHIIPKEKGGTGHNDNLSISHWKCNNMKANKIIDKADITTE